MVDAIQTLNTSLNLALVPNNSPANSASNNKLDQNKSFDLNSLINSLNALNNPVEKNFWQQTWLWLTGIFAITLGTGILLLKKHVKGKQPLLDRKTAHPSQTESKRASLAIEQSNREERILSVMRPGNEGLSCHTMATLNAMRAYYTLKGENVPSWLNDPDGGKEHAFKFIRALGGSALKLEDNGNSHGRTSRVASKVIFDNSGLPSTYYAVGLIDGKKDLTALIRVLCDLEEEKIGTLGTDIKGGHLVTVYGFKPGKDYESLRDIFHGLLTGNISEIPHEFRGTNGNLFKESLDLGKFQLYDQHGGTGAFSLSLQEVLSKENLDFTIIDSEFKSVSGIDKVFNDLKREVELDCC